MSKINYHVDKTDVRSVETLITDFGARGTDYEQAIRAALSLHEQSFVLFVDHINRPELSPLDDPFSFNPMTRELALFSEEPPVLVDAILDMAIFLAGFETLTRTGEDWEIHVATGSRRFLRMGLKTRLNLEPESTWRVTLELHMVQDFNLAVFSTIAYLASRPNLDVDFPAGSSAQAIHAYHRLSRIMEAIAFGLDLGDSERYNRRLRRALHWIAQDILPSGDISPFDNLLGPEGFNPQFFEDDPNGAPP